MDDALRTLPEPWGGTYEQVRLDDDVSYIDFAGTGEGPPVVFVHGLGGSSLNWSLLAQRMRPNHSGLYAIDLAGHGLTRATTLSPTVPANIDLVARFVREVVGGPVVLIGNSMGGLITSQVAYLHPELVSAAVLENPAMPSPLAASGKQARSLKTLFTPTVRGIRAQRAGKPIPMDDQIRMVMDMVFAEPDALDPQLLDALVTLGRVRAGFPEMLKANAVAARSTIGTVANRIRMKRRFAAIQPPVLLLHGRKDKLVPVEAAMWTARTNPSWTYVEWPDTGHVPMMEHPDRTAETIEGWITETLG